MVFTSDYKMIVATLYLNAMHRRKIVISKIQQQKRQARILNYDTTALVKKEKLRCEYQKHIEEKLNTKINRAVTRNRSIN